jgi:hypothetical protein
MCREITRLEFSEGLVLGGQVVIPSIRLYQSRHSTSGRVALRVAELEHGSEDITLQIGTRA